jgi:hypothetical protein
MLAARGELDQDLVEAELLAAALDTGLPEADAGQHPQWPAGRCPVSPYHRILVDYVETSGNAKIGLTITPPSGLHPQLQPNYGLPTTSIDARSRATQTEYTDRPELGGPTKTTVLANPATADMAANPDLATTITYEPAGAGKYHRPATRRLPSGANSQITYSYYAAGAGEAAPSNNCSVTDTNTACSSPPRRPTPMAPAPPPPSSTKTSTTSAAGSSPPTSWVISAGRAPLMTAGAALLRSSCRSMPPPARPPR